MENVETDSALLLENALRERVGLIVRQEVERAVVNHIGRVMTAEKDKMLMEVSIKIGQMLRGIEEDKRRPLWESTPEEFGLTKEDLNRTSMGRLADIPED